MEIVSINNHEYDLNAILNFMDDDLCQMVKNDFPDSSNQEFVDEFCKLYYIRYSEVFSIKNVLKRSLLKKFK
ncbi:MAG: hypothetical protein HGA27_03695 [Peptococcaceae bacterium]|nr:hypothetical protein [Peptococcaceae bacterium]